MSQTTVISPISLIPGTLQWPSFTVQNTHVLTTGGGMDSHHLGGTWWCGGNTATDPSPPWCQASGTSSGSLTALGYWRCPRPNPWCSDWKKFWNLKGIELDIGNSIGLKSTLKSTMYHNICKISTKHSNH